MAQDKDPKTLNVPPLRFPGFTDEWNNNPLTHFFEFKNGLNPDAKRFGQGVKFISVSDILNNDFIEYDKIIASVTPTQKEMREFGVNSGDILFQRSSETLEDVGRANVFLDDRTALFGGFVIRGKKIGEYDPYFMRYALSAPVNRKKIIVKGAGAQHFNIGQDGLSKVEINTPITPEQVRIGNLLRRIDERIATQNKIIEDLKKLKSAIIDTLIGESDFPKIRFEAIYDRAGEGGTPATSIKEYYMNGEIPFVKIEDLANKYLISSKDYITELGLSKSSSWVVPINSIIYSNGATIGAISINKIPVCTKQGILGIVPKKQYDVEYLYYLMTTTYFRKQVERIVTEGTMRTAYLKDINNIECPIPDLGQQKKIASILGGLSSKLELEQSILMNYTNQKRFFLLSMFI